ALETTECITTHGDYSPKNLILSQDSTLNVLDFVRAPDFNSPLRDISIFVIGLARALAVARGIHLSRARNEVERLIQHFLNGYLLSFPKAMQSRELTVERLAIFEIIRLVEMKIWLDDYK